MKGPCSVEQFWAEVARIGWKDRNPHRFYHQVERDILERWDDEFLTTFREHMDEFVGAVQSRIERYEEAEGVSCGCSDDGFSDLTHHIVGLGKEEYEKVMIDPEYAIARGRKGNYEESFSYCIPHERRVKEQLTYEQAMARVEAECKDEGDYDGPEDRQGHMEQEALELVLGERCKLDPRYYRAWARRDIGNLERLAMSPYADECPDLPYVLECVTRILNGEIASVVDEGHEFKAAAARLREQREGIVRKLREEFEEKCRVLESRGWSLDNLAGDALVYIGRDDDAA